MFRVSFFIIFDNFLIILIIFDPLPNDETAASSQEHDSSSSSAGLKCSIIFLHTFFHLAVSLKTLWPGVGTISGAEPREQTCGLVSFSEAEMSS